METTVFAQPRPHPLALRDYQEEAITAIVPRDYQVAAITASLDGWVEGLRRILLALPTGAGKTVIFALIIRHFLAQGGRVLVVAHRDELIDQAVAKLRDVLGADADIGVVKAERDEVNARIVVASVQTLARAHRLERLGGGFGLVVIDEAHHAPAGSYQRILDHLGCFDHDGPLLLGVTATPNRADKVGLDGTFEKIVFELNILDLIKAGHLVDLKAVQVGLDADFDALHTQSGDFFDSETGAMLLAVDAPTTIAEAYQEHAGDRRGIVFTPTINVAHATADAFVNAGIPAAALDGGTPNDDRRGILQGLRSGEIQVVTNCGVLTEGTDLP